MKTNVDTTVTTRPSTAEKVSVLMVMLSALSAGAVLVVMLLPLDQPTPEPTLVLPNIVPHPRFVQDATMTKLRAAACYDANGNAITPCTVSSQWNTYKSWMDNVYEDEQGAKDYALVYLVTKNPTYKTKALEKADAILTVPLQIDGSNEDLVGERWLYTDGRVRDIAYVYDLLFNELDSQRKIDYRNWLQQVNYMIWTPSGGAKPNPYLSWDGWATNDSKNNFHYGHLQIAALVAFSTHGDGSSQFTWTLDCLDPDVCKNPALKGTVFSDIQYPLDPRSPTNTVFYSSPFEFFFNFLNNQTIPGYLDSVGNNGANGGGWHEGENYGMASFGSLFEALTMARNATGLDYFASEYFAQQSLYHMLYNIQPGDDVRYSGGDASWKSNFPISYKNRRIFLFLAQGLHGPYPAESSYAQYWLNHIFPEMRLGDKLDDDSSSFFWDYLLYDSSLPERDYRLDLPLGYYAENINWINSRSSWNNDAVSVSFMSEDRIVNHQHQDQNGFQIYKGNAAGDNNTNGWLVFDGIVYFPNGEIGEHQSLLHNIIAVDTMGARASCTSKCNTCQRSGSGTGKITKHTFGSNYTYAVGDASDAYYADLYGCTSTAASYSIKLLERFDRELVHVKPNYIVVYDRVKPTAAAVNKNIRNLFHFKNAPQITGGIVTDSNGGNNVFQTVLSPTNAVITTFSDDDIDVDANSYRIEVTSSTLQSDYRFLNVFEVVDASQTNRHGTRKLTSTDGSFEGVAIQDISSNTVILFSKNGSVTTSPTTYSNFSFSNASTRHLVMNMNPNQRYTIKMNGVNKGSYLSNGQGVLDFTTNGAFGNSTYTVTPALGGGSGCFLEGTPVLMADGSTKAIETITTGEHIMAYDETTGELIKNEVIKTFVRRQEGYILINGRLKVSPPHQFLSEGEWVDVTELEEGDAITTASGRSEMIRSLQKFGGTHDVYNLEVAPDHTYIVDGYVVHNKIIFEVPG